MNGKDGQIIQCRQCQTRNRLPGDRDVKSAKCGKCGAALSPEEKTGEGMPGYTLRCVDCGTKNRVPENRSKENPKCGKCGVSLKTEELFLPQPVLVNDANFEQRVLQSPLPVLLYCWAPWCPTCGSVSPTIDAFAREAKGRIRVCKMNVDASPVMSNQLNVMSVPFLFIYDNGRIRESIPGGLSHQDLRMKMAKYL